MLCSNCGKNIPFNGKVCPWCRVDKTGDQQRYVKAFAIAIVGGVIGAVVGGWGGWFCGLIIGAVVGGIVTA